MIMEEFLIPKIKKREIKIITNNYYTTKSNNIWKKMEDWLVFEDERNFAIRKEKIFFPSKKPLENCSVIGGKKTYFIIII